MPLVGAVDIAPQLGIKSADILQFFNLLTGVMQDQPVNLKHQLLVGGGSTIGAASPVLTVKGIAAQSGSLIVAQDNLGNPLFEVGPTGSMIQHGATSVTTGTGGVTVAGGGLTVTAGSLQVTAGNVGIGSAASAGIGALIAGSPLSGVNQYGFVSEPTITSSATALAIGFESNLQTVAAVFTIPSAIGFHAVSPSKGAGTVITNNYGMLVESQTAGNTNNYGVYVNAPSGGSGNNFGIYNAGKQLYGDDLFSVGTFSTTMTSGFLYVPSYNGPPTGVPNSHSGNVPLYYDATNNKFYAYNGGWKGVGLA